MSTKVAQPEPLSLELPLYLEPLGYGTRGLRDPSALASACGFASTSRSASSRAVGAFGITGDHHRREGQPGQRGTARSGLRFIFFAAMIFSLRSRECLDSTRAGVNTQRRCRPTPIASSSFP